MLLGRAGERRRIDRVLDAAREGQSGSLLVLGDSGSGKSALLSWARERAEGMRVLTARGLESEAELPFAGLSELLPPVLGFLEGLPVAQRSALEGALALGPASAGDRFGAYVATLSLLVAAAEEQPLLVVVDDAHWLDASSVEALRFAARRLGEEGIAVVFAAREGELGGFDPAGLEELRIAGLEPAAAGALLARSADGTVAPEVAKSLIEGCAGNPLALVELPRLLSPAQLEGTEPLDQPLPLGPGLERSHQRGSQGSVARGQGKARARARGRRDRRSESTAVFKSRARSAAVRHPQLRSARVASRGSPRA